MPSMRQSMSWSPSVRRMFFTLVPTFTTSDDPFTFRSLITVTGIHMSFHPIAGVVWYAVGRLYESLDGTLLDAGYFGESVWALRRRTSQAWPECAATVSSDWRRAPKMRSGDVPRTRKTS